MLTSVAPLAELDAFKARMGWTVPWYSCRDRRFEVRELFDGANTAHVATLMRDGAPHCVPMWIGVEGDRLAFLSSPTSVKGRNVRRDPRVSISATDAARPNSMAQVRGRVGEILEGDPAWEIIDRIAHKYIDGCE